MEEAFRPKPSSIGIYFLNNRSTLEYSRYTLDIEAINAIEVLKTLS